MLGLSPRVSADAHITAVVPSEDKVFLEKVASQFNVSRNEILRRVLADFRVRYQSTNPS